MRLLLIAIVAIGISNTAAILPASSSADTELAAGTQDYYAGRYSSAIKHFSNASAQDPGNAAAHYLLASALCAVDRDDKTALKEYAIAARLNPTGQVGLLAKSALANLTAKLGAVRGSQAQGLDTANTAPEAKKSSSLTTGAAIGGSKQSTAVPVIPAVSAAQKTHATAVGNAVSEIRQQATDEALRTERRSEGLADSMRRQANAEAAQLRIQAADEINNMRNAVIFGPDGKASAVYSPSQIDRKEAEYEDRIQYAINAGEINAANQRASASKKAAALGQMAESLADQLQNGSGIGPKLLPQGTNLYVRNYLPGSGSAPHADAGDPVELLAQPNRMVLEPVPSSARSASHGIPAAASAAADKLTLEHQPNLPKKQSSQEPQRQLDVHGRLMNGN